MLVRTRVYTCTVLHTHRAHTHFAKAPRSLQIHEHKPIFILLNNKERKSQAKKRAKTKSIKCKC